MRLYTHLVFAFFLSATTGCVTLPSHIPDTAVTSLSPTIKLNAERCRMRLNELRSSARLDDVGSSTMVIFGSALSGTGGVVALLSESDQKTAGAYLALSGAIIAGVSKIVESPATPLEKHRRAEDHWRAARKFMSKNEAYANERFEECASSDPNPIVPPPS